MQTFNFETTALKVKLQSGSLYEDSATIELDLALESPENIKYTQDGAAEQTRWFLSIEENKGAYCDDSFPTVGKVHRIEPRTDRQTITYLISIRLNARQFDRLSRNTRANFKPPSVEIEVDGLSQEGFDEVIWGIDTAKTLPVSNFSISWSKPYPSAETDA